MTSAALRARIFKSQGARLRIGGETDSDVTSACLILTCAILQTAQAVPVPHPPQMTPTAPVTALPPNAPAMMIATRPAWEETCLILKCAILGWAVPDHPLSIFEAPISISLLDLLTQANPDEDDKKKKKPKLNVPAVDPSQYFPPSPTQQIYNPGVSKSWPSGWLII
jgi:hypothetical protein